ncbi:MAG TPA: hypothetical protein PK640_15950 [Verrucomicrobiota bacterium]|nr:hypothetical protein [Verrucomicrobiota bacterium]
MTDQEAIVLYGQYEDRFGPLFGDGEVPPHWDIDPRFWDMLKAAIRVGNPISLAQAEAVFGKRQWEHVLSPPPDESPGKMPEAR